MILHLKILGKCYDLVKVGFPLTMPFDDLRSFHRKGIRYQNPLAEFHVFAGRAIAPRWKSRE
jgi:hypothetical protein